MAAGEMFKILKRGIHIYLPCGDGLVGLDDSSMTAIAFPNIRRVPLSRPGSCGPPDNRVESP